MNLGNFCQRNFASYPWLGVDRGSPSKMRTPALQIRHLFSAHPLIDLRHQGMCLNTPARTSAANVNASNTAQVSSENRFVFAAMACCASLIDLSSPSQTGKSVKTVVCGVIFE